MTSLGFSFDGKATPFRLCGTKELEKRSKRPRKGRPTLGLAVSSIQKRGKREVGHRFEEILILDGLPRELFQTVAAHELCHAWLFFKGFRELPVHVEEGLCTLAEAIWLRRQDTEMARLRLTRLAESEDPIYGKGYRQASASLEKMSLTDLLRYVFKHRKFPVSDWLGRLGLR